MLSPFVEETPGGLLFHGEPGPRPAESSPKIGYKDHFVSFRDENVKGLPWDFFRGAVRGAGGVATIMR
jgi:hypothetical protein